MYPEQYYEILDILNEIKDDNDSIILKEQIDKVNELLKQHVIGFKEFSGT